MVDSNVENKPRCISQSSWQAITDINIGSDCTLIATLITTLEFVSNIKVNHCKAFNSTNAKLKSSENSNGIKSKG